MNKHQQPRSGRRPSRRSNARGNTRPLASRRRPVPSARPRNRTSGLDPAGTAIGPTNRTFEDEPNKESKK